MPCTFFLTFLHFLLFAFTFFSLPHNLLLLYIIEVFISLQFVGIINFFTPRCHFSTRLQFWSISANKRVVRRFVFSHFHLFYYTSFAHFRFDSFYLRNSIGRCFSFFYFAIRIFLFAFILFLLLFWRHLLLELHFFRMFSARSSGFLNTLFI